MPSLIRLDNGQIFVLKGQQTETLGRGSDASIFIDNEGVSRKHAQIISGNGIWEVADLGSRNGISVNGRQAERAFLSPGDRITLGPIELMFTADGTSSNSNRPKAGVNSGHKTLSNLQESFTETVEYLSSEPVLNAVSRELSSEWLRRLVLSSIEITACSNEMDVYETLDTSLLNAFTFDQIYLGLADAERGSNAGFLDAAEGEPDQSRISKDILRRSLSDGKSVLVKNVAQALIADGRELNAKKVFSVISVPLLRPEKTPYGVVYLDNTKRSFTNDEFGFTRALCWQAGLHLASIANHPTVGPQTRSIRLMLPGSSRAAALVMDRVLALGPLETPALILGCSGSDFNLHAKAIHSHSQRSSLRMLHVNCAEIAGHDVIEELFGGNGFQGRLRQAQAGTMMLGNAEHLPVNVQSLLVERLLEWQNLGETAIRQAPRFIFTSTLPISELRQRLLPALIHWITASTLQLPSLQERHEDLPSLVDFYFQRARIESGRRNLELDADARRRLLSRTWSGNEIELASCLRTAATRSTGPLLTLADMTKV